MDLNLKKLTEKLTEKQAAPPRCRRERAEGWEGDGLDWLVERTTAHCMSRSSW